MSAQRIEDLEFSQRIIRIKGVMLRTGLSRSYIYHLSAVGSFPKSIPLVPGGTSVGWVSAEITEWIESRINARDEDASND